MEYHRIEYMVLKSITEISIYLMLDGRISKIWVKVMVGIGRTSLYLINLFSIR